MASAKQWPFSTPRRPPRRSSCAMRREELWRRDGRWTSSALDVSYVEGERRWELSVLDRDWRVDRFDLETGAALGSLQVPRPTFTSQPARRLVRLSVRRVPRTKRFCTRGMFSAESPVRWAWARAVAAGSRRTGDGLASQQRTLREMGDQFQKLCAAGEANATPPPADAPLGLLSERLANVLPHGMGLAGGSLRFVDISGPQPRGDDDRGRPSRDLRRARQRVANRSRRPARGGSRWDADHGGDGQRLGAGSGRRRVVVAERCRALAALARREDLDAHRRDPGRICGGHALVDLDGDGSDEVLVGTQDGWLRVYSAALELLFEWSAGDLNAGVNGALFAVKVPGGVRAAFAVSGGFRVIEISRQAAFGK